MAKEPTSTDKPSATAAGNQKPITCGIVMPIAAMGDDYPEEHWRRVRKVLQRAVERAGMKSQLVWENPEVDVIHSAILQNLYENDVVICDVSGLNPNVMLEAGLRLSTKKPTVIVTDRKVKPPFDIGVVGYIDYQPDLEYNATEIFIDRLTDKIKSVHQSYKSGSYKSFVENFTFETVTPSTVNVSGEEYLKEQIDLLVSAVRRIESKDNRALRITPATSSQNALSPDRSVSILIEANDERAFSVEFSLDMLEGFGASKSIKVGENNYRLTLPIKSRRISFEDANAEIVDILEKHGVEKYSVSFSG